MRDEQRLSLASLPPVTRLASALRDLPRADGAGPVSLAYAPGRLDVMGGIADYSGSRVCELPLAVGAAGGVWFEQGGPAAAAVWCHSARGDRGWSQTVAVPMPVATAADPGVLREVLTGEDRWARYLAGCIWWLANHGPAEARQGWHERRVHLTLDSDVPSGGGVSSSAAIEVATMAALCDALDLTLDPMTLAAACQQVEHRVVGAPCGLMDQATSALGRADQLLVLLCQPALDEAGDSQGPPAQVEGYLPLPPGLAVAEIFSGVRHDVGGDPYTHTRVASFMGERILAADCGLNTRGYLANVDREVYIRMCRRRLPEAMTGEAFLTRYGPTADGVTRVEESKAYHVRAATDHHVLEASRVRRFIHGWREGIERGSVPREDAATLGALMTESHTSYGHIGLGHPATDRLAALVRDAGPDRGLYGGRITGGGSGGTVAVLLRDDARAWETLDVVQRTYETETGRETTLLRGSGPGAAQVGTMQLTLA